MGRLNASLVVARLLIIGLPKPIGVSIDVTNRCNLRCEHCYFWRQDYEYELSDDNWLEKIRELINQHKSIVQASWCGGEPLLRKELISEAMRFFKYNIVVTNGTIPLPEGHNCIFEVSIDGLRSEHDFIRGIGTHDKIKDNVKNSRGMYINIACILNKINHTSLEDIIEEWLTIGAKGIHFGFYSPTKTSSQYDLRLEPKLKDETISRISALKSKYGNFILPTQRVLDLMSSKNCEEVTSNCPFNDYIVCLGPDGERKSCPAGEQAICLECGHSPPFFIEAIRQKDLETLRFIYRQIQRQDERRNLK